jgi:uncharacterized membrane protein
MDIDVLYGSLHVLAFAVYIGGLFYSEFVLAPAAGAVAPAQGVVVRRKAGDLQAIVAWSSLGVILITGILRLSSMGVLDTSGTFLLDPGIASSDYGQTIFTMFGLWCVLVGLGIVMTFVLRPVLIGKIDPKLSQQERQQRQDRMMVAARWMTVVLRVDLAVAVSIAVLGVSLRYGGLI